MIRIIRTLALGSFAPALLALVTAPLLARGLETSGRGQYATLIVGSALSAAVLSSGLDEAVAFFASARSLPRRRPFAFAVSTIALTSGGLVALYGYFYLHTEQHIALWLIVSATFTAPITNVARGYAQHQSRYRLITLESITSNALRAAILVLFYVASYLSVTTACIATLCASISSVLIYWPLYADLARASVQPQEKSGRVNNLIAYSAKSSLGGVSSVANARVDQFFLASTVSTSALGIYAVAVTIAELVTPLFGAIRTALFSESLGKSARSALRWVRLIPIVGILIGAILFAGSIFLVTPVFGSSYAGIISLLPVLVVGTMMQAFTGVCGGVLASVGSPGRAAISQIIGFAVTLVLLGVLVPSLGTHGAALATALGYLAAAVFAASVLAKSAGVKFRDVVLPGGNADLT